jgi:hypothetical protein
MTNYDSCRVSIAADCQHVCRYSSFTCMSVILAFQPRVASSGAETYSFVFQSHVAGSTPRTSFHVSIVSKGRQCRAARPHPGYFQIALRLVEALGRQEGGVEQGSRYPTVTVRRTPDYHELYSIGLNVHDTAAKRLVQCSFATSTQTMNMRLSN